MRRALPLIAAVLLAAALILPSCAGPAVREQSQVVEHHQGELTAALEGLAGTKAALEAALLAPPSPENEEQVAILEAQVKALLTQVESLGKVLQAAVSELPQAWADDIESAKGQGESLIGGFLHPGGAQGGLASLGVAAAMWWLRDQRKKKGTDPLQVGGTFTPPTQEGGK